MGKVTVFISNTSGNRQAKAQQDHLRHVLEAKRINFTEVDLGDPRYEAEKAMLKSVISTLKSSEDNNQQEADNNALSTCMQGAEGADMQEIDVHTQSLIRSFQNDFPLPPQIFNNGAYRGDYWSFFTALECERLYEYLNLDAPEEEVEFQRKHEPQVITNTAKA